MRRSGPCPQMIGPSVIVVSLSWAWHTPTNGVSYHTVQIRLLPATISHIVSIYLLKLPECLKHLTNQVGF